MSPENLMKWPHKTRAKQAGRARVANSWNCFSGIQASAVDTRLGLIRLTGLLDLNSSTCILCKGRSTLSSKKWNLVARFYLELWLMHWQCVPASRSTRKAFTLASWFPPSYPMQIRFSDLQVLVFEQSMCHTASPTTHCLSPVAITAQGSSRHGIGSHPAVIHPQPTL